MDYYEQFRRAAIKQGVPEDEAERFAGLLRFTVCANRRHDGHVLPYPQGLPPGQTADVVVGRTGGLPRLPVGMPWPTTDPGVPLPFVASFDCAALPRVDGLPLPLDGSLLVFLHHEDAYDTDRRSEEQQFARLVHVPAGTETVVATLADYPRNHFTTEREFIGPEHDLFATVHADLPAWLADEDDEDAEELTSFQEQLARDLPHRRELRALVDQLWPNGNFAAFQFGGYSWNTGELSRDGMYDVPELTIAEENVSARQKSGATVIDPDQEDFLVEEEQQRVQREWIPLVQLDPGSPVYFARFLIRVEDLTAGRFDRAVSWTEFTE
ncbi:DUF1963 domain-containing protein [Promicromonospora aerolata]|uniref:DUF1963 domain-containing protein n=1 Tax=Promicromonospora aerolata TaxID=195749 RepID=A0ABW4VFS1_9MICO